MDLDDDNQQDICRVCRSESASGRPLFHPCICTGSIKYIHQDCLVQWLKFSKKEICELCNHKFSFMPIYSADCPSRLPIKDLIYGISRNLLNAIKFWLHAILVATAWLVFVPFLSYRLINCLFDGSIYSMLSLKLISIDFLTYDKLLIHLLYGAISVMITVTIVIAIIWLRETIIRELPQWLANENPQSQQQNNNQPQQNVQAAVDNNLELNDNRENVNNNNNNLRINEPEEEIDESAANDVVEREDNLNNNNNNDLPDDVQEAEISFERIFGLDGSLLFLEHVFWIISLNGFFVFLFAFCPYHIGLYCLSKFLDIYQTTNDDNKIEKVLITFVGYLLIGLSLVLLHYLLFKFSRARSLLAIGYLIVKVFVVTVLEVLLMPIICGVLMDAFSLPLFNATITEREVFFKESPVVSTFVHWSVGFCYIFYVTSFVVLMKDHLKPPLATFLNSINNPDFSPVQEIIHLSVLNIIRRYIIYVIIFSLLTFNTIYLPVKATEKLFPNFLPYNIFTSADTNSTTDGNDLTIDIYRLHIMTPLLYDYSHLKICTKSLMIHLCYFFAFILNLKSYLFIQDDEQNLEEINEQNNDDNNENNQQQNDNQQEEEVNLINSNQQQNQQQLPNYFYLRLFSLLGLMSLSIFLFGFFYFTFPAFIGRRLLGLFINHKISELYTIACGLYIIICTIKIVNLLHKWIPLGFNVIYSKLKEAALLTFKTIIVAVLLCGFLPQLIGLFVEVVLFVPLRVASNQTPVYYLIQDWLLGILIIKVVVLMGLFNDWNLRETLEEFYQAGFVNIDLKKIVTKFILPIFFAIGLILSVPYVLVYGILPQFGYNYELLSVILRKMYLSIFCSFIIAYVLQWQYFKFCKLYEHIKNERYLIGTRLLNYDSTKKTTTEPHNKSRPFLALGI